MYSFNKLTLLLLLALNIFVSNQNTLLGTINFDYFTQNNVYICIFEILMFGNSFQVSYVNAM